MTIEQLKDRIAKKEKDIEKIERRISKWSTGLRPEDIAVCKSFGDCNYGTKSYHQSWSDYHGTPEFQRAYSNYKNYIATHKDIPESSDYSKGPNIQELYSAYRDLGEARLTLAKYQAEVNKIINFENEEKIEVIWNFLLDWKEQAREWYCQNCAKYFELKKNYEETHQKFLSEYDGKPEYWVERSWEKQYYNSIDALTKEIIKIKYNYVHDENSWTYSAVPESYTIDEDKLEKYLDKEMKSKYQRLIQEITHITGEITDAKGLSISPKGEIDGIVIGKEGKAKVLTFKAGLEYIVQCPHFRTKISAIK